MKKENTLSPSFSRFFDDFFKNELYEWGHNHSSATGTTIPAVNIKKTNDHFEVEMAAPGMEKKDFKIELNGNRLSISSEREVLINEGEERNYVKREFSYQSFDRSFT
ncbi:MAG: Hsp20/alpha crystallin family protein, partial [Flammeovirgaceae bacterium]|nr:Hsp20/alpha crystallin family protein [Flammeovirgaceae bacterium]